MVETLMLCNCILQISEITTAEISSVEESTRGQANNKSCMKKRSMRLTSSHFGTLCKSTERRDMIACCGGLLTPKELKTKALEHGKRYEAVAVERYEKQMNVSTQECGLFISESFPYLAASPDRLHGDDTVIEVKCPFTACAKDITSKTVPYLEMQGGTLRLKTSHDYHYQIQGQLYCTKRSMGHLVVFTLKDIAIIEVPRDEDFISRMLDKRHHIYAVHFKDSLLNKYLYKEYNKYSFVY